MWERKMMTAGLRIAVAAAVLGMSQAGARADVVFSTDFEAGVPAALSPGVAALTGVEGFSGLGPVGNVFGGQFLRSQTGNEVTLTLIDLPTHTHISLGFLLAAIDSLDGTGSFPQGDFLRITLDGAEIFRESFANAADYQVQSYEPAAAGVLARRVDLGFQGPGGYYTDSAYDMFLEPRLQNLSHTASSATFTFVMEGPGVQDLSDESWAMDNVTVSVTAVPEPSVAWLTVVGLLAAGLVRRRSQA